MQPGDRVRTVGRSRGLEGTVVSVREGTSVEDHGCIEVRLTAVTSAYRGLDRDHLKPGDVEHFVHFGNLLLEKF